MLVRIMVCPPAVWLMIGIQCRGYETVLQEIVPHIRQDADLFGGA